MADGSKIEWTGATWNPIVGCSIHSPGCTNCYAMSMARRIEAMQPASHYAGTTEVVKGKAVWTGKLALAPEHILTQPLRWQRSRAIFVNSMGDLFHEDAPDEDIDEVFAVMKLARTRGHTLQVLTKRVARMRSYMTDPGTPVRVARAMMKHLVEGLLIADIDVGQARANWVTAHIWLGASTEDQRRADERRDDLAALAAAGWRTFVSYEPALGPVDWRGWEFLSWLISGGESGRDARPSHPDWHRAGRDFCAAHGIPYFFKQWGAYAPLERAAPVHNAAWPPRAVAWPDGTIGPGTAKARGGAGQALFLGTKSVTGRILDGVEHNAMPEARP